MAEPIGVPLTQGYVTLIDPEDLDLVSRHRWKILRTARKAYAARNAGKLKGTIYLHRLIVPDAPVVDHRDGDGLNNRRANLRAATKSLNAANSPKPKGSASSQFKGVRWHKIRQTWEARIVSTTVGFFADETDAARAYDSAAVGRWGEFAWLNFPEEL